MAEPSETTLWTITGAVVAGLGLAGLGAWYFQETLKRLLPPPLRIARRLKTRDIVPSDGTHFTILIADLDGDDDHLSQTKHIEAALRGQQGLEVVLIGPGPSPFEMGSRAEHQIRAEIQAREKLAYHNGDLLIWGEVAEANLRLRLRFLPRQEEVEGRHGNYQLEAAELPKDFGEDFNAQLVALALASLAPDTEQQGRFVVNLLKRPVRKLERLLEKETPEFDPDKIAELRLALARVALTLGEQTGDVGWLRKSIDDGRKALEHVTRDRLPVEWARAQNNLGIAFTLLGRRESGTSHSEEAVTAYRAALEEYTRDRLPMNWAMTQNNLGNALMLLGEREGSTALLEEAAASFQAALEQWTRQRVPLDWAMAQNNLGNALALLGKRGRGTKNLEDAVAAYRAALEERTRERVPLDWAATQSNLGNVLIELGKREAGTARLEDAVVAYRAALEERTRERVPLQWAESQNNLGTALKALGEREADTTRLEEAVTAHRGALEEYTREHAPMDWAGTQNNLGNALQALGERESSTERLEEAVSAYRAALDEWTRERVPLDWAMAQNNLGNTLRMLGQRKPDTARLEEAVASFRAALAERARDRIPLQWATTQNNLGVALAILGARDSDMTRVEEAVAAFRAALGERTRETVPLDWAMTQTNLGNALCMLAGKQPGTACLEEALAAYQAALQERTRERYPFLWAQTQEDLGGALRMLGEREQSKSRVEQAVAAIRGALEVFEQSGAKYNVERAKGNLASAEASLAELRRSDVARGRGGARMSDEVEFYMAPQTRAVTVHWMLEEASAPYRMHVLDLEKGEHKQPEFLAINPMGKVPAIVHRGTVLTEVAAICLYLADEFPAADLAPPIGDPRRGSYLRWLIFVPSCVEPAMVDRGLNRPPGPARSLGYGDFDTTVDVLAQALAPGPYLLGQQFSGADVLIGSTVRWGMFVKLLPERPEFLAYAGRLNERPALQRALEQEAALSAQRP